ncbi:MAG: hypothetical protein GXP62_21020 [Oligoflexia bacterium]|nr:hypothetical protein [Oligoflexia bacterium]
MINGAVVGIVIDNVDPDGMHRVKVKYPVDSGDELKSSWCRMMSPMAGKDRGLVILPDIDTEVVLMYAYRTMSPYVVGAVYNGADDTPEPYHNDDSNDDKRVFWSRNDHMLIFDDTAGAERVDFGAQASTRLDVTSAPIYHTLESATMVINEYCAGDTKLEAAKTLSLKCKDFKLTATKSVSLKAGQTANLKATTSAKITSGANQIYLAAMVDVNPGSPPADPEKASTLPTHKHPPTTA